MKIIISQFDYISNYKLFNCNFRGGNKIRQGPGSAAVEEGPEEVLAEVGKTLHEAVTERHANSEQKDFTV